MQAKRTDEEWNQGGGFNRDMVYERLQEQWQEEDEELLELKRIAAEEDPVVNSV